MTLINRSSEPEAVVRAARQKKQKKAINMQVLAEKILQLLKKEARLERERQGPR